MPAYKKQHYLPAVYLQQFSEDQVNPSRNSFIWRTDLKGAKRVPLVSQCAKDYHYSKTEAEKVERMFAKGEGLYAEIVRKLKDRRGTTIKDYYGLIILMADIHIRNAAQQNLTGDENIKAYQYLMVALRYLFLNRAGTEPIPEEQEVADHLQNYWRLRVVMAPRMSGLVTSDHPAIFIASYHLSPRLQMILMPLTYAHMAIAYDWRMIQLTGKGMTEQDVGRFNNMQAQVAREAIFSGARLDAESEANAKELLSRPKTTGKVLLEGWSGHFLRFPDQLPSFIRATPPLM